VRDETKCNSKPLGILLYKTNKTRLDDGW